MFHVTFRGVAPGRQLGFPKALCLCGPLSQLIMRGPYRDDRGCELKGCHAVEREF